MTTKHPVHLTAIALLTLSLNTRAASHLENWGQWRGPEHSGASPSANPPIRWSENNNVLWKTTIPGRGNSTPIVWGDKVFLVTSINTGKVDPILPKPEDQPKRIFGITHPNTSYTFVTLCLDRNTGREIWRRTANELIPHEGHHKDSSFASSSPVTDGERLYSWFGSAGLFCYDLNGKQLWQRDLGQVQVGASLGEGTSPALYNGTLVIVRDHSGQSTIETLDAKTGKTLWKKSRDENNTWATPAIVKHSGRTQVITSGSNKIRSYDLTTGEIIWECGGLTGNAIPSPVIQGDHVICMTGYQGYSALALPLSAKGDITGSDKIIWSIGRGTPYVPSPLLYDGLIWFNQSNQALWTCVDATTGEVYLDRERLSDVRNIYSSPVGADGRIYITDRSGTTLVLAREKGVKVLATNKLDDSIDSSPALAGDQLFLRGERFLYCLSSKAGANKPKLNMLKDLDRSSKLASVSLTKDEGKSSTVSGVVRFEGPRPSRQGLGMDAASLKLHKSRPLDENVLISENGALANVFVQVKKGVERKEYPAPEKTVMIDQVGSIFHPRVQGVMVGQKLVMRNSDPFIHNVRSLSLKNRAFNIAQPPKTADRETVFKRQEGPIRIGCDFHRWMKAYLFVVDHPYFAVTDAKGFFRIEGLPAGEYTLEAWHEEFGKQQAEITVDNSGSAKLHFVFKSE